MHCTHTVWKKKFWFWSQAFSGFSNIKGSSVETSLSKERNTGLNNSKWKVVHLFRQYTPSRDINQDAQIEEIEKSGLYLLLINHIIFNTKLVIVDKISHLLVSVTKSLHHQEPSFSLTHPWPTYAVLLHERAPCGTLHKEKHHWIYH